MGAARPFRPGEHKGALYQLKTTAAPGQHVSFAGVWDRYGVVIKHHDSGYHLIRGLGHKPPEGVRSFIRAEVEHS